MLLLYAGRYGTSDTIRYFGLIFELSGLAVVARELARAQIDHGKPGLVSALVAWCKSFFSVFSPSFKGPHTHIFVGSAHMSMGGSAVFAIGRASGNKTIQEEIAEIHDRIDAVEKTISENKGELEAKIREVGTKIQADLNEIGQKVSALETEIANVGARDLRNEIFGILLVAFGLLFATIPDELHGLLQ